MSKSKIEAAIWGMERNPDIPYVVTVHNSHGEHVCEYCRSLEGSHYNEAIYDLPATPFEKCTSKHGCRCWMSWSTALGSGPPRQKSHERLDLQSEELEEQRSLSIWDRLIRRKSEI